LWRFPARQVGLVSRNEQAVDDADNDDSLMAKLDFINETTPGFLPGAVKDVGYRRNLAKHSLRNLSNRASINGYAATGDVARGGRKFCMMMDEFHAFESGHDYHALSSTQHVTDCRIFISTVDPSKGPSGAFFELVMEFREKRAELIEMHWSLDPRKRPGLYRGGADGRVQKLDPGYEYPADYRFVCDEKMRSPYYDLQEARAPNKAANACELDMLFQSGSYAVIDPFLIQRLRRGAERTVRPPDFEGMIEYDEQTLEASFVVRRGGPFKIWMPLSTDGEPGRLTQYSLGADVSSGTGGETSSNSTILGIDRRTGQVVLAYWSNVILPLPFARLMVATSCWLRDAFGGWAIVNPEAMGGHGTTCVNEIERLRREGIPVNPYRERRGVRSKKTGLGELRIGLWHQTPEKKQEMFSRVDRGLREGRLKVACDEALKELGEYVYNAGAPVHRMERTTHDESAKGKAHGDIAIGLCCAWWACEEVVFHAPERDRPRHVPSDPHIMAARLKHYELQDSELDSEFTW
jgi:hypothetical protein